MMLALDVGKVLRARTIIAKCLCRIANITILRVWYVSARVIDVWLTDQRMADGVSQRVANNLGNIAWCYEQTHFIRKIANNNKRGETLI